MSASPSGAFVRSTNSPSPALRSEERGEGIGLRPAGSPANSKFFIPTSTFPSGVGLYLTDRICQNVVRTMKQPILLALAALALTGCAAFNKFDVRRADVQSPSGSSSVAVCGVDERAELRTGEIGPDLLGKTRDGYGIPFQVKTATKRPLALEVAEVVTTGFGTGRKLAPATSAPTVEAALKTLAGTGTERRVVIRIREWWSDTLIRTSVWKNLRVEVYDSKNKLVASAEESGEVALGGNFFNPAIHARKTVLRELGSSLTRLMNQPQVAAALR